MLGLFLIEGHYARAALSGEGVMDPWRGGKVSGGRGLLPEGCPCHCVVAVVFDCRGDLIDRVLVEAG